MRANHRTDRRTGRHTASDAEGALVDYRAAILADQGDTRWHFFKEDQHWHAVEGGAAVCGAVQGLAPWSSACTQPYATQTEPDVCAACAQARPYRFRCERDSGELRTFLCGLKPGERIEVRWTGGPDLMVRVVEACPTVATVERGGLRARITIGDLYHGRVRLTGDLLRWWLLEPDQLKASDLFNRYVLERG